MSAHLQMASSSLIDELKYQFPSSTSPTGVISLLSVIAAYVEAVNEEILRLEQRLPQPPQGS